MSIRRDLSKEEHSMVEIWLRNINVNNLEPKFKSMVLSIGEQYEKDSRLSDAQLDILRQSKYVSDIVKRNDHIRAYGSIERYPDSSTKLNTVYNPMKR